MFTKEAFEIFSSEKQICHHCLAIHIHVMGTILASCPLWTPFPLTASPRTDIFCKVSDGEGAKVHNSHNMFATRVFSCSVFLSLYLCLCVCVSTFTVLAFVQSLGKSTLFCQFSLSHMYFPNNILPNLPWILFTKPALIIRDANIILSYKHCTSHIFSKSHINFLFCF